MTEMLLEWLNKEVKLSKTVSDIGEEFSNGYLIGEILHKFKQIPNFSEYKNKEDSDTRTHNFQLVEKALRDLDIKVIPKSMKEISEKRRGVAARFLYQIKMCMSKKGINFERLLLSNSNQLHNAYTSIKFPNQNGKYLIDALNKQSSPIDNNNNIKAQSMRNAKLAGIDINKNTEVNPKVNNRLISELKLIEEKIKEENNFKDEHDLNAKGIYTKEKNAHMSNLGKDEKGLKSWTNNLSEMRDWEKKQQIEDMKEANFFKELVINAFNKSAKENEIQIDVFDKNLSRLGLDIATIDPKMKKHSNMSSEIVMQKIKEKMETQAEGKKEKDRRNRLNNVEQAKAQKEIQNIKTEELLKSNDGSGNIANDPLGSAHQKRLDYENWRILHDRQTKTEMKLNNKNNDDINLMASKTSTSFNRDEFLFNLKKENLKFRIKELERKKAKKIIHSNLCSGVLNMIISIVEDAYEYQTSKNEDLIDLSEWRTWMNNFIYNKNEDKLTSYFENQVSGLDIQEEKSGLLNNNKIPQQNELDMSGANININNNFINSESDDNELLDYINLKGQWSQQLVPKESLNTLLKINEILGPEFFNQQGIKKRASYVSHEYEPKDEEIENLTTPSGNTKNLFLGEIIEIITDVKFSDKITNDNPSSSGISVYSHIPIKISLIGHSFAGKKTLAKSITDSNPNLKIYNIEEILKKTIETLERLETPIEANPKFKTLKKNQIDQLQLERTQDEEKFKHMKAIILPIRDAIVNNVPVNDELIVSLLFENIKHDFPEKDPNLVIEEAIKKNKRKKDILEELAKIKEEQAKKAKVKVKEEQQLTAELIKITSESNKGFVLIDFPQNKEQAKILEHKLTGYVQDIDKPKNSIAAIKDNIGIILDKPIKAAASRKLKQGGLDLVIQIDVPSSECIRRAVGRRVDPTNGNIYHIEDNPAPVNDIKLHDRLQPIDDIMSTEAKIKLKNDEFDFMVKDLNLFYDPFGFCKNGLKLFNILNGFRIKDAVMKDLVDYVNQLMSINEEKELEAAGIIRELTGTTIGNNLSVYPNSPGLHDQNAIEKNAIQSRGASFIDGNEKNGDAFQVNQVIDEEDFNKYLKKLEETRKKLNLKVLESLFDQWNRLYDSYTSGCKGIFKSFKKQRETISNNFSRLLTKFTDFLKRPSKKLEESAKYAVKYNKFADEYPELREDRQVKDEFHQDVVDLSDRIWEIIDIRKNEAIEERRKIMASGWIEKEMEKFHIHLEKLFVMEVEKFLMSMSVIRDYYTGMDLKNSILAEVNILNFIKPNEILSGISTIPLETSNISYPKIDKIYNNCVRIIFVYEEKLKMYITSVNRVKPLNSLTDLTPQKRLIRSLTFRKIAQLEAYIEEKRDIFLYEEELRTSTKYEKQKFKFRVTLLKHWGIDNLKKMRTIANTIYNTLDDWIISTIKAENEGMNNLVDSLRSDIEREKKVRLDTVLDGFDIYEHIDIQHLFDSVIGPKPLKDIKESAKFNITKFHEVMNELKNYEVQKNIIKISSFVDIYFKKHLIDLNSKGVPMTLKELSFLNYNKFIKNFEYGNTNEFINLKNISTILALIHCRILDETCEKTIIAKAEGVLLNNITITREEFMKIEFWFEKDLNNEEYEDDSDRAQVLKEIIFEIYKEENNTLLLPDFLNLLSLRCINSGIYTEEARKQNKTYYEILLF